VARQTGAEYRNEYECPDVVAYIWGYFIELVDSKTDKKIRHSDILAWATLRHILLSEYELNVISTLNGLVNKHNDS
jgi:hypothetical protein